MAQRSQEHFLQRPNRRLLRNFHSFITTTSAMAYIAVPIPSLPGKQDIEIEVTINGMKQQLHYRVELFYWDDCAFPTIDRAECIRQMLSNYDEDWTLYYIGSPTEAFVPITFVKKGDIALQRKLMLGQAV